ncbi:MAG: DinB family protein [Ferruginibacter sp.]
MSNRIFADAFIQELQTEYNATKRCLERIPQNLFEYKPHPKSMNMGYLSLLVAEIPLWISTAIEKGAVDFATYERYQLTTGQALTEHFENCFEGAVVALQNNDDKLMEEPFLLQDNGKVLMRQTRKECVSSSINHWVHHRGQLTVYMRLNDILVPSIYGPSADEKTF